MSSDNKELTVFLDEMHKSDGYYKGEKMNLFELQNKIHEQNVVMGWWDEARPFSTFVCLFHSELSEAMEGDRKGLMDDHLPQYEMFWVELADFVIRCMDFLGSTGFSGSDYDEASCMLGDSIERQPRLRVLSGLHLGVSLALIEDDNGSYGESYSIIAGVILTAFMLADNESVNLHQIILEKVEYNKHRSDHKKENRAKDGGKKY